MRSHPFKASTHILYLGGSPSLVSAHAISIADLPDGDMEIPPLVSGTVPKTDTGP